MGTSRPDASSPPVQRKGLIAGLISLPFQIFGMLLGSLCLSILVECVGVHWFWRDQQWHHAEQMLEYELDQLTQHFTQSVIVREPGKTAHRWVLLTYEHVFARTGVIAWAERRATEAKSSAHREQGAKRVLGMVYAQVEIYALAAIYTTLTFVVRVLVLCLMLPLFMTAAFVGLVDGLVRRDVRRFGAGRESGFLYHRARAAILPVLTLPWVIYLAMPVSVHPLLIFLPCAAVLALAVNITAGSFKKYL